MPIVFKKSATQYTKMLPVEHADGTIWLQVQAHDTLVADTPYMILMNEYGWITAALADATTYTYIGVADAAAAAADIVWVQIGGYKASMVTAAITTAVG